MFERPTRRSENPGSRLWRPMDVLVLIDKLDDLVHNAKAVPSRTRSDRPRGDLRHPRPDAGDDSGGDQAGLLDREGAAEMLAEAKRETDRTSARRGAGRARGVADRDRQARRAAGAGDRRRLPQAGLRDALEMEDWPTGSSRRSRSTWTSSSPRSSAAASGCTSVAGDRRRRDRPTEPDLREPEDDASYL